MKFRLQQVPVEVVAAEERRLNEWVAFWIGVAAGLAVPTATVQRYLWCFAGSDWGLKRSYVQESSRRGAPGSSKRRPAIVR